MYKIEKNQSVMTGDLIIKQFINNENNMLEKIYQHNYKIVRNYVLKNNGSESDAKDIFQDAIMITWMNLKEGKFVVKNEFSLSAYLYKIAKYKWLDKLKSPKNKITSNMKVHDFKDEAIGQDEYFESERKLKYLGILFSRLDSKCKEVLNQFYYERKNLEEIANHLSYDIGSIRTIKYRCMQKLRKMHANSQIQID